MQVITIRDHPANRTESLYRLVISKLAFAQSVSSACTGPQKLTYGYDKCLRVCEMHTLVVFILAIVTSQLGRLFVVTTKSFRCSKLLNYSGCLYGD